MFIRIDYDIEQRAAIIEKIMSENKVIRQDVTIGLDDNGRLTNCYFVVEDAIIQEPDLMR